MKNKSPTLNDLQVCLKSEITSLEDHTPVPFIVKERMDVEDRLAVYSDAYFSRIVEALEIDFEATCKVLGKETFFELVKDYLKEFPSTSTNIDEIGSKLPDFIRKLDPGITIPYLSELAQVEWALIEAFYADDLPLFDPNSLRKVPHASWDKVKLIMDTSVKLIETKWPVHIIWEARKSSIVPEIRQSPGLYLIYRNGYSVELREKSETEFKALKLAQDGQNIGTICEGLKKEMTSEELMMIFKSWMQSGLIRDLGV